MMQDLTRGERAGEGDGRRGEDGSTKSHYHIFGIFTVLFNLHCERNKKKTERKENMFPWELNMAISAVLNNTTDSLALLHPLPNATLEMSLVTPLHLTISIPLILEGNRML